MKVICIIDEVMGSGAESTTLVRRVQRSAPLTPKQTTFQEFGTCFSGAVSQPGHHQSEIYGVSVPVVQQGPCRSLERGDESEFPQSLVDWLRGFWRMMNLFNQQSLIRGELPLLC